MKLKRSIDTEIRDFVSLDHRWRSADEGLIWCWERGRQMSEEDPELASRARNGELMLLNWTGGIHVKFDEEGDLVMPMVKRKKGTLHYLAQWQGLTGKDLDIDTDRPTTLVCSLTGVKVTYSKNGWKPKKKK